MKKKSKVELEESLNGPVLLRDANDDNYPYHENIQNFHEEPKWNHYKYLGQTHNRLKFLIRKQLAYILEDGSFDILEGIYDREVVGESPWDRDMEEDKEKAKEIERFWNELPANNKIYHFIYGIIDYQNIIAIDKEGDNLFKSPHIYVEFQPLKGPFTKVYNCFEDFSGEHITIDQNKRIKFFLPKYQKYSIPTRFGRVDPIPNSFGD